MTAHGRETFGRRGRQPDPPCARPVAASRVLSRPPDSLWRLCFGLDRRVAPLGFLVAFALTTVACLPGVGVLARLPRVADALVVDPVRTAAALALLAIPAALQMVYFVRRMHDQGYDSVEAVVLFALTLAAFAASVRAGHPLAAAASVGVYFGFGFARGSRCANRWGPPSPVRS